MYIKLSFHEEIVIVPQCWGGLVLSLSTKPQIVDQLPLHIQTNKRVNERPNRDSNKTNFVPSDYDYYLNCGTTDLAIIQKALDLFDQRFKGKPAGMIVDESYPKTNPIISKLETDLHRAKNSISSHPMLFSKSTFSGNKESFPLEQSNKKRFR